MKAVSEEADELESDVPKLEEESSVLATRLTEAESKLEEMQSDIRGEVEEYSKKLQEASCHLR
eukprot:scaffold543753_cov38-Prasinocladus_malaysianus.AAC.1